MNKNGLNTRTWLALIGIGLTVIILVTGGMAYNYNTFAQKEDVRKIERRFDKFEEKLDKIQKSVWGLYKQ